MRSVRLCTTGKAGSEDDARPCACRSAPATKSAAMPRAAIAGALVDACTIAPATVRRAAFAVRCASAVTPSLTMLRRRLKLSSAPPPALPVADWGSNTNEEDAAVTAGSPAVSCLALLGATGARPLGADSPAASADTCCHEDGSAARSSTGLSAYKSPADSATVLVGPGGAAGSRRQYVASW